MNPKQKSKTVMVLIGGMALLSATVFGQLAVRAKAPNKAGQGINKSFAFAAATTAGSAASPGTGLCIWISPGGNEYGADQQNDSLQVTAMSSSCQWQVQSDVPWITITSPAAGMGTGSVSFNIQSNIGAPNAETPERFGDVNVATGDPTYPTLSFLADQDGCFFRIADNNVLVPAFAGTYSQRVFTGSMTCPWTVASDIPWLIPITPGGAGDGSAGYAVAANPSTSTRSAFISIAGQPLMVTQAGASCSYQLSPASRTVGPQSSTGSITVYAPLGCAWTAKSMADWITITSAVSGSSTGTLTYALAANPGPAREGMVTIADQTFTLDQAAAAGHADLSVMITPSESPVAAGTRPGYTMVVHNAGPDPADGVTLSTATPNGTSFASMSAPGSSTTPPVGGAGAISSSIDSIPANGSASVTLELNVIGAPGSSLPANASVSSLTADPVQGNNSANVTTQILGGSVVELSWDQAPSTAASPNPAPANLRVSPASSPKPKASALGAPSSGSDTCTLTGYNIYLSNSTSPPETVPANLWLALSPAGSALVPVAPDGASYVVTALWSCGGTITESGLTGSGGSNQTSLPAPPSITGVSIADKLRATGSGFSDAVDVFLDGVGFLKPAGVRNENTLIIQKGPLTDGRAPSDVLVQGKTVIVSFRNSNGGIGALSYTQP
jgi:uncharacterized repeat protein (TIGR01451 family)